MLSEPRIDVDYRRSNSLQIKGKPALDCYCGEFFLAALANGYDVAKAATPLELPARFRYVADDRCGASLGLAEDDPLDRLLADVLGAHPVDDYPIPYALP